MHCVLQFQMDIQSKFEGEKQKQQPLNSPFLLRLMSLSLTFSLHFLLFDTTYQTYHQQRFAKLFCAKVDLRNILH